MTWKKWEEAAERGPEAVAQKIIWCFVGLAIPIFLITTVLGWMGETMTVARKELAPSTLLKRYEWFKDIASQIDARYASITIYEQRFKSLKEAYAGQSRSKWSREDREQANLWEQEVAGIKASYNALAAEYNAAMAKINWAYCNAGELPRGAEKALPREFKVYDSK